jgi:hypothetical protein
MRRNVICHVVLQVELKMGLMHIFEATYIQRLANLMRKVW